ncbi:hypothetical protein OR1_01459 [Geobacter sp. OR-1]|uniref:hypothetical protein n=1 Tax=Geobacter sp. OR-1 TaxID=1266765 RepID=UPI000543D93B|nr:hypothetical protein [Geobacter sp. OR-1]GAM09185.1 hypothetical protein OR1_01459 [Geobacter sp. OR-1]
MMRFFTFLLLALVALFATGCSHNYYNIPRESYEKKVRTLGVAPLFTDADSDIRHPDRDMLVALIKDFNRKNEPELVAGIKNSGNYFSVTLLNEDPDKLFANIFFRREKRDDAGIVYNKYFYKGPEIRELITKNNLDALLLLVVSGITTRENIYSSNLMSKLEADYNYLTISGQIIDSEGNVLWEFPNFRQRRLSYPRFIALQYPDFDEANANETDKVDVKFKTVQGINRSLGKSSPSQLRRNAAVSDVYASIFDEMVAMLRHPTSPFGGEKKESPPAQPRQQPPAVEKPPVTAPADPVAPTSTTAPPPLTVPAKTESPAPIVPPPGSPPAEPIASPSIAPAN